MNNNSKSSNIDEQDVKMLIKLCLIINFTLPILLYGILLESKEKLTLNIVLTAVIIIVGITSWAILILFSNSNKLIRRGVLYFGFLTTLYSTAFFWIYYQMLYKIMFVKSSLYAILGMAGYVMFIIYVIYYKYRVYKEAYKNKSGKPNFSIILLITIFGSILAKGYLEKLSEERKVFILALGALFISYVFSIGVSLLFDYCVLVRNKD